jgi:tRNA(Ile)-lysidine synthase TilS/MesJ
MSTVVHKYKTTEAQRKANRKWNAAHPEKCKEYARKSLQKNREKCREVNKLAMRRKREWQRAMGDFITLAENLTHIM